MNSSQSSFTLIIDTQTDGRYIITFGAADKGAVGQTRRAVGECFHTCIVSISMARACRSSDSFAVWTVSVSTSRARLARRSSYNVDYSQTTVSEGLAPLCFCGWLLHMIRPVLMT